MFLNLKLTIEVERFGFNNENTSQINSEELNRSYYLEGIEKIGCTLYGAHEELCSEILRFSVENLRLDQINTNLLSHTRIFETYTIHGNTTYCQHSININTDFKPLLSKEIDSPQCLSIFFLFAWGELPFIRSYFINSENCLPNIFWKPLYLKDSNER